MKYEVIDDSNYNKLIGIGPINGGYGLVPRNYDKVEYGAVEYAGPVPIPLIPVDEWADRILQMEREKSGLVDIIDGVGVPCMYQNGVGYCHAFSIAHAAMCLRAMMGEPFALLSPSSVGGPVTGYRNKGAWIYDDLKQATEVGFSETRFYAELTTDNVWTPEAEESASRNRVTEWWELKRRSVQETMTCLLSRFPVPVGLNWWAHSINYLQPVIIRKNVYGVIAQNSHKPPNEPGDGRLVLELVDLTNPNKPRYGKGTPDEAYCPRQMSPSNPLPA